jgi:tyrosyl-tRNA synthetase
MSVSFHLVGTCANGDNCRLMNALEAVLGELQWRGLVADQTFDAAQRSAGTIHSEQAASAAAIGDGSMDGAPVGIPGQPLVLYCGFDPTADSLHVGNLVPLLGLRRFQLLGHHPIALAGGATGLIGDPSGKTVERQLITRELLNHNISRVKGQLQRLLDFETTVNPARLVDNATWMAPVTFLDFLRDIGKHFSVNMMMAKESVRARMEDRDVGISYTEFSYMLLQAYDYLVLCRDYDCNLQIGGSDQWGNITAGIELCRKKLGRSVHGLTLSLITNTDGSKFGKSVEGAVWLDPAKTSVYRFYQFWIRTDDRDVIRYLKFFTFLPRETIETLERDHHQDPGARAAHRALAKAVTDLVHGSNATIEAQRASEILFGGDLSGITENTFNEIVGEIPTIDIQRSKFDGAGAPLVELLVDARLATSKGQARKDIEGGGVYLNNRRESGVQRAVTQAELLFGRHLLLRKGKRNYTVLSVV